MDELFLDIAGFTIAIYFHTSESDYTKNWYLDHLRKYYKVFITNQRKKIDFSINFVWDNNQEIIVREQENKYFLKFYRRLGRTSFETYYTISPFQFDTLLREIIYELLQMHPGFILHASAVEIGSEAFLFLGNSGAGKSTSVKLLRKTFEPLADEAIILKEVNQKFYVYQTPFIEKEPWIWKTNKKYRLGRIFFLQKSKQFSDEKINKSDEIRDRFLQQIYFHDKQLGVQMDYIDRFIKKFEEFYILKFAKDEQKMTAHFQHHK